MHVKDHLYKESVVFDTSIGYCSLYKSDKCWVSTYYLRVHFMVVLIFKIEDIIANKCLYNMSPIASV